MFPSQRAGHVSRGEYRRQDTRIDRRKTQGMYVLQTMRCASTAELHIDSSRTVSGRLTGHPCTNHAFTNRGQLPKLHRGFVQARCVVRATNAHGLQNDHLPASRKRPTSVSAVLTNAKLCAPMHRQ